MHRFKKPELDWKEQKKEADLIPSKIDELSDELFEWEMRLPYPWFACDNDDRYNEHIVRTNYQLIH